MKRTKIKYRQSVRAKCADMHQKRLAAGLRPDMGVGKLTELPRSLDELEGRGGKEGRDKEGRQGKRGDR